MSSAFTKKVQTKGIIMVKYSQCAKHANKNAAVDSKNKNQYRPVDFLDVSMIRTLNLCEGKAKQVIIIYLVMKKFQKFFHFVKSRF
jgi:hypothetical protein